MVLFNGTLIFLTADYNGDGVSEFFPLSTQGETAKNMSEIKSNETFYRNISSERMILNAITAGGGLFTLVVIGAVVFKQNVQVFIGVGMFIGILTGLWVAAASLIGSVIIDYPIVNALWLLMTVVIGILATISVAEMFTGGGGGN